MPGWLTACAAGQEVATEVNPLESRSGIRHFVRWHHWPWRRAEGRIGGLVAFAEVLNDMIEDQRALKERNNRLARANADLEMFGAIIAHDLRAPLRQMSLGLETLRGAGGEDCAERGRLVTRLQVQAQRMAQLLDELLDYALLTKGSAALSRIKLKDAVDALRETVPGAERFRFELDATPEDIDAPAPLVDLVLRNLLSNAVRHHHRRDGFIRIRLREDAACYRLAVEDDGPGIPPVLRSGLFDGHGADAAASGQGARRFTGGLGLALIRKALENYGGAIALAHSETGTAIEVCLPKPHGSDAGQGAADLHCLEVAG
jgi:signal transduction histidine kinase